MGKALGIAGWILAAVAIGTAAFYMQDRHRLTGRIAALESDLAGAKGAVEKLTALERRAQAVRGKTAASAAAPAPAAAPAATEAAPAALAPSDAGEVSASLKPVKPPVKKAARKAAEPRPASEAPARPSLAQQVAGGVGKEMLKGSAKMAYKMQYDQFFKKLKLTPEKEQQVREIMMRNLGDMMGDGMSLFGAVPAAETERIQAAEQKLHDELSGVLTADQLAQWEQYADQMPDQMLTQLMSMQLEKYAPGISPESRDRVREIMMEEMTATPPAENPNAAVVDLMQQGMERARDRAAQELSPEEFEQVNAYFGKQIQALNSSARLLNALPKSN